jgi:hypothetical protein
MHLRFHLTNCLIIPIIVLTHTESGEKGSGHRGQSTTHHCNSSREEVRAYQRSRDNREDDGSDLQPSVSVLGTLIL